jgi:phospholipid/cholesterol/gamma-HCH transport system substrate-binding protein
MSPSGREVRVGLVILAALAVLAAGIFLIGNKNNLFSRKNHYYTEFQSVSGLKPGSPVQIDGVDVGTIEKVLLPQNPRHPLIQVWVKIDRAYAERLRGPLPPARPGKAPPSQARIQSLGLLGDKFIEINSGPPEYPVIPADGEIPAAQPTNVDALLASGEDVMGNLVEISHSLSRILGRMDRGEGLLGELTTDTPAGRRMRDSLVATSESLQRAAAKLESGQGPLPRLLNDRAMADRLATSLDRLEGLLAQAQNGPGLLPGLLNDAAARARFDDALASLDKVARDLQAFTAELDKNGGLLPRLVNDEEYGRQVSEEVRRIVERLGEVADKLARGQGTAAKLIDDPQVYDAVKDILVGVNESRLLRWLIRNRQKAGIEKRYEETRRAVAGAPPAEGEEKPPATPPSPPPPPPRERP